MKTKQTNPTRPGSPTQCKQALSSIDRHYQRQNNISLSSVSARLATSRPLVREAADRERRSRERSYEIRRRTISFSRWISVVGNRPSLLTFKPIEEALHALFESHINMHSVCLPKFAKVNCFQLSRKYPIPQGHLKKQFMQNLGANRVYDGWFENREFLNSWEFI